MKFKAMITAMLIAFSLFAALPAAAGEGSVTIDVSADPAGIPGPGKVGVTAKVACADNAAYLMQEVKLYKGDSLIAQADKIQPAQIKTMSGVMSVSSAELGSSITLTLKWKEDGTAYSKNAEVKVAKGSVTPKVTFTRAFADASASGKISVAYKVQNTGSAYLSSLKITDFGVTVGTVEDLYPGASKEVYYDVQPSADTVSEPTLKYSAYGKEYDTALPAQKVQASASDVSLSVTPSKSNVLSEEEITLTFVLKNDSKSDYNTIKIIDTSDGSTLFTATKLAKGASKSFTKSVKISAETAFKYKATMKDSTGASLEALSEVVSVTFGEQKSLVSGTVAADKTTLAVGESAKVTFALINAGTAALGNVSVQDESGKEYAKADSLKTGMSELAADIAPTQSGTYSFFVVVRSGAADETKVALGSLTFSVTQSTPVPTEAATPTPAPTQAQSELQDTGSSWLIVLIVALIVICLGFVALIVIKLIQSNGRLRGGK